MNLLFLQKRIDLRFAHLFRDYNVPSPRSFTPTGFFRLFIGAKISKHSRAAGFHATDKSQLRHVSYISCQQLLNMSKSFKWVLEREYEKHIKTPD